MISTATLRPVAAPALMAVVIVACLAEPAFAQAAGVETVLQNIVDMLTGNIARLLAVIAVIIICIAWILRFLLERQGQISTREQLIEAVWPDPDKVESRTVDVHIGRLRRAFAGLRNLSIRTVYGAGYALEYHDH
ncbi:winged helix-turn-helix domain-containing protein [Rhizobium leguminosarum]|jgi:type IV secretory pathway VirB2 component (pilin)|uniref:winged helix-turn-helix domain-containing protein n=1 Tax=Rhizobium leguminosarum TaxID=384 RepID=UPI001E1AD97D|nr:hypothetical protein [Rhizobium leguminosarum]MBY2991194.1 hypothetical protein [Rhizobium leguminosarum]MBY3024957.1 hypothetical protein [Rhizobium leguminosarum]MBY3057373.1 hypothetical protein [Rhizobium leguminosarum]